MAQSEKRDGKGPRRKLDVRLSVIYGLPQDRARPLVDCDLLEEIAHFVKLGDRDIHILDLVGAFVVQDVAGNLNVGLVAGRTFGRAEIPDPLGKW